MKHKIIKYIIAVAVLFSTTAMSTEVNAQFAQSKNGVSEWVTEPPKTSSSGSDGLPFVDPRPPAYAPPPEGGEGQKIPLTEGLWILIGLAMSYGIVRRKQKEKDVI